MIETESIPRRQMTLFFMIDKSGSMIGNKIGSVNDAIKNVLPIIGEISDENPDDTELTKKIRKNYGGFCCLRCS